MKNLYKILGVDQRASTKDIEQAYRGKARFLHPDKGGNVEDMQLLNLAYNILSDPSERKKFDQEWEFSYEIEEFKSQTSGFLSEAGVAFSKAFREKHIQFYHQFKDNKSRINDNPHSLLTRCNYDLLSSIIDKKDLETKFSIDPLTPETAVEHFINFLQGNYFGSGLKELSREFCKTIKCLERSGQQSSCEFQLYCGIYEIFLVVIKEKKLDILSSLQKITEYARRTADQSMGFMAPLLHNKQFRELFSQAVHYYWLSTENILDIGAFNGQEATKQLIENLKVKLSANRDAGAPDEQLLKLLRPVRLLLKLEQDIEKRADNKIADLAAFYRQKALHLLDWIPALFSVADRAIVVNTMLQSGMILMAAAKRADLQDKNLSNIQNPAMQKTAQKMKLMCMADEKLAAVIFYNAVAISRQTTPDVELYACLHSVKCLISSIYINSELEEMIKTLQQRTLWLADLFPFVQKPQANVNFLTKEDQDLVLMRQSLHALINKNPGELAEIDYNRTKVLYQAFEACLRNWYQKNYDPETEKIFRQQLMQELLSGNGWRDSDLETNLNAPFLSSDVDEQGWSAAKSVLQLAKKEEITTYKTVHGVGFNESSGEMAFVFEECNPDEADHNHLLTIFDLNELLKLDLRSAIFSLDPVDPNIPYHPFNQMRFSPTSLHQSQLLHTMLLTDYMLKFLTIGQEVQRVSPFNLRSLEEMTSHLPAHLKKIITDFHASYHEESMSRFWIESEGVEVVIDDKPESQTRIEGCDIFYALGDIKMVVRHHKLERNAAGELVDKDGETEGWDCYVFTPEQKRALDSGKIVISDAAFIIVERSWEVFVWENNKATSLPLEGFDKNALVALSKRNCDGQGKIDIVEDLESRRQVYRFVVRVAEKAGVSHRYSPEFIFAQEFSKHYDEFAIYFPEFGRLRELSKTVAMVDIMHTHRENNQEKTKKIKEILENPNHDYWRKVKQKVALDFKNQISKKFRELFQKINREINNEQLEKVNNIKRNVDDTLREIKTKNSELVNSLREKINDTIYDVPAQYLHIEGQYQSTCKAALRDQLLSSFKEKLGKYIDSEINQLLNGNHEPFLNRLINHDKAALREQLLPSFKEVLGSEVNWAVDKLLNGDSSSILKSLIDQGKRQAAAQFEKTYPYPQRKKDLMPRMSWWERIFYPLQAAAEQRMFEEQQALIELKISYFRGAIDGNQSDINTIINEHFTIEFSKVLKEHVAEHEKQLVKQLDKFSEVEKSFVNLGFGDDAKKEVDLKNKCLWVPASFNHEVANSRSRTVYGGVQIAVKKIFIKCFDYEGMKTLLRQKKKRAITLWQNHVFGQTNNNMAALIVRQQYPPPKYIVEQEYSVNTKNNGWRRLDVAVLLAEEEGIVPKEERTIVAAWEIKTGNSPYLRLQRIKDEDIREERMEDKKPVQKLRVTGITPVFKDFLNDLKQGMGHGE